MEDAPFPSTLGLVAEAWNYSGRSQVSCMDLFVCTQGLCRKEEKVKEMARCGRLSSGELWERLRGWGHVTGREAGRSLQGRMRERLFLRFVFEDSSQREPVPTVSLFFPPGRADV